MLGSAAMTQERLNGKASIMKRTGTFIPLLFALTTHAQSWCPPGAKWTFEYADMLGGQFGVERVEYVGDTMVGGHLAQRLRETSVTAPWGSTDYVSQSYSSLHTYFDSGVVYLWNGIAAYDTLMWFSAAPGQRWNAPEDPENGLTVTDTATVVMDGVPLRRLIVETDMGPWMSDTLYERIGFEFLYLAGWSWFLTDMPWSGLRCYQDNDLAFTNVGASDCGFTLFIAGGDDRLERLPFPNPGTDHFMLSLPPGRKDIVLSDATGRVVRRSASSDQLVRVDTSDLDPGLYGFLVLAPSGRAVARGTWVRQ